MPDFTEPISINTNVDLSDAQAQLIATTIRRKRDSLVGVATPEGWDLYSYLGDPIGAPDTVSGGVLQRYLRGFIVERAHGGVFVVYGFVADAWMRLGGPEGFVGLPTGDTQVTAGPGAWTQFDGADITWSQASGAHEIHGGIRDRWRALGGPSWGLPSSDESSSTSADGREIGRFNSFPNGGGIYWSPTTGAWEVLGAIGVQWNRAEGGPAGRLGFPVGGESDTPGGRFSQFEHGVIVWRPDGPYAGTWTVTDLVFVLDHFHSSYDEIHVAVHVNVTDPDQSNEFWVPGESAYVPDPPAGWTHSIPVVTPTTAVDVWMDGLGYHNLGKDERLGHIVHRYDITNLWGLVGENPDHGVTEAANPDYSFGAVYSLQTTPPPDLRPFRESRFWPFHNFHTPELSKADYAQTFAGIKENEYAFWHPFDRFFYNHTYKGMAADGNCFGMALEALYALRHQSVFGEPIFDSPFLKYSSALAQGASPSPETEPDDARFATPVNIRHGYQFGEAAHEWKGDARESRLVTDPLRVFEMSKALHDAGELQVLLLRYKGEGHAVLPYSWEENGSVRTIHIANPNTPPARVADDNAAANVITITTTGAVAEWSFEVGVGTVWKGGTEAGGEILHIPFSLLSYRSIRAGGGDIFGSSSNSALIVVGEGTTASVSHSGATGAMSGHYEWGVPGLVRLPVSSGPVMGEGSRTGAKKNTEPDAAAPFREGSEVYRLKRPLDLPTAREARARAIASRLAPPTHNDEDPSIELPTGSAPSIDDLMRQVGRIASTGIAAHALQDQTLRWEFEPTEGTNSWAMRSGFGSIVAEISGSAAADVVEVGGIISGLPALRVTASGAAAARLATVTLTGPTSLRSAATRVVTVKGLAVDVSGCSVQLVADGDGVSISNPAAAATCSIRFSTGADSADFLERDSIELAAGAVTTVTPADWGTLAQNQKLTLLQHNALDGSLIRQKEI